jgi:hypothetical protein
MGKKTRSGSGMSIWIIFSRTKKQFFGIKILKSGIQNLFDPGSGMEKFGFGIRDKHSGSATLGLTFTLYRTVLPGIGGIKVSCSLIETRDPESNI